MSFEGLDEGSHAGVVRVGKIAFCLSPALSPRTTKKDGQQLPFGEKEEEDLQNVVSCSSSCRKDLMSVRYSFKGAERTKERRKKRTERTIR